MRRLGTGLIIYLYIGTKRSNNNKKARFSITVINNEDFRKLLMGFSNSPYLGYKNKQVHN